MSFGETESRNATLRPEIELAWRRAELSGLNPGMDVRETDIVDVEKRTSLSLAASPILDQMVDELADTRFAVLLADRSSRIIDRRVHHAAVGRALDRVLAAPGFQYLEETSGTNSLATAFELRRPIAVTGGEHFLEALRGFCCYGAPIIHPVTHRLEGVIDVSGPVADATSLLGPFLTRAARGIEERLLEGARFAEKQLLTEFQAHGNQRHAVIALGEDFVLANAAAVDLIKGDDHVALRAIAADLPNHSAHECSLLLSSGSEVTVRARLVASTRGGALFEVLEQPGPPPKPAPTPKSTAKNRQRATSATSARIVAVTGEPGTGRTTTACNLAGKDCTVFDAGEAVVDEDAWLVAVRHALTDRYPVVIDNIDALSPRLAVLLAGPVQASRAQVVLTSAPLPELQGSHRALASLALTRHDLQPLRMMPHRLAAAAKSLLAELSPTSTVELAPSALQVLAAQHWAGNFRELRAVLEHAARGRQRGVITDSDFPESIRAQATSPRTLTFMESLERDAIIAALQASNGNRAAAAVELGIGRTTLYARLRRYRITDAAVRCGVRNRNSSEPD